MSYSQTNIEQIFRLIGSLPHQVYAETDSFDYVRTVSNAWPNQLLNLKSSEENLASLLDKMEAEIEKGLIPSLLMCSDQSDAVIEAIEQRGYPSRQWSAMSFDLKSNEILEPKSSFPIRSVCSENELADWLSIVESELMGEKKMDRVIFGELLQRDDCHFMLAFAYEKPVGTALLFQSGNEAGVYLVATLKTHRKKGIGTQLTAACLQKAKGLNCTQVHLQATALGEPVYQSMGFVKHGLIKVFRIND